MPDRLIALDRGRIVQTGAPLDVRARPCTLAIAELTGPIARLAVTVVGDGDGYWITGDGVRIRAWAPRLDAHVGCELTLAARPEGVAQGPPGAAQLLEAARRTLEGADHEWGGVGRRQLQIQVDVVKPPGVGR